MLFVQKYGGTSLADSARIRRAALRAAELVSRGAEVVMVVSAQGDATDEMIAKADEKSARADEIFAKAEKMIASARAIEAEHEKMIAEMAQLKALMKKHGLGE